MSEESFHRDAARIARIEWKKAKQRRDNDRARRWLRQANWHDIQGDSARTINEYQRRADDFFILLAKEAVVNGWVVGYLSNPDVDETSHVIIQHPFIGPICHDIESYLVPSWIPIYPEIHEERDQTLAIGLYLRKD